MDAWEGDYKLFILRGTGNGYFCAWLFQCSPQALQCHGTEPSEAMVPSLLHVPGDLGLAKPTVTWIPSRIQ